MGKSPIFFVQKLGVNCTWTVHISIMSISTCLWYDQGDINKPMTFMQSSIQIRSTRVLINKMNKNCNGTWALLWFYGENALWCVVSLSPLPFLVHELYRCNTFLLSLTNISKMGNVIKRTCNSSIQPEFMESIHEAK